MLGTLEENIARLFPKLWKEIEESYPQYKEKLITLYEKDIAWIPMPLEAALAEIRRRELSVIEKKTVNQGQYEEFEREFNRQVENLVKKDFLKLIGINKKKFATIFEPLKERLKGLSDREFEEGHIPFVIVPGKKLLALGKQIQLMEVDGGKGFTLLDFSELKTADSVKIPKAAVYLLVDVENGKAMLGKSSDEAINQFKKEGRSPLTAEEGVALTIQYPEILKYNCMDLSGSRYCANSVACLWLEKGLPRLGWSSVDSFNPDWGSASCGSRVGL